MPLRLKYPILWPTVIASNDLSSSIGLFRYTEFGLLVRKNLEVEGPYEVPNTYFTEWRETDTGSRHGRGLHGSHEEFEKHSEEMLGFAKNQFIVNAFSIFEFYIANTIILVWGYSSGKFKQNDKLILKWNEDKCRQFLANSVIEDIEEDSWIRDNYKSRVQEERIKLLKTELNIDLKDFKSEVNGSLIDWSFFRANERYRHNVAHTAGRNSLYVSNGLERKNIETEEIKSLYWYLEDLFGFVNSQLNESQVFEYEH